MTVGREKMVILHVPIWVRRKAGIGPAYFFCREGRGYPKRDP